MYLPRWCCDRRGHRRLSGLDRCHSTDEEHPLEHRPATALSHRKPKPDKPTYLKSFAEQGEAQRWHACAGSPDQV